MNYFSKNRQLALQSVGISQVITQTSCGMSCREDEYTDAYIVVQIHLLKFDKIGIHSRHVASGLDAEPDPILL